MTVSSFPALYAQSRRFTTGAPRTFKVRADGSEVLFLRSQGELDPVLCLWATDTATGSERLVVDPSALATGTEEIPAAELARRERARESANGIVSYSMSTDGNQVCFALGGSLVIADVDTGVTVMADTGDAVFDPRFSPDGSSIAYVSGQSLRAFILGGDGDCLLAGPEADVVGSGDPNHQSWGSAEFVAAEEMGRSRGYWWAPDSNSLLVAMVDVSTVDSWWISDPAHPHKGANEVRYPAAGTNNALVQLWHIDGPNRSRESVAPRAPIKIDWDQGGKYEYLADVVWSDGEETAPLVVRQTRDQRTTSIATIDLASGLVTDRHTITNDVWVELIPGSPTVHGLGLLTVEDLNETDQRALCLDGAALTDSSLQVRAIVGISANVVTFTASPEPTEVHIYSLDLETKHQEQLTSEPGVHNGSMSGSKLVISSATPTTPGTVTRVDEQTIVSLATKPPMAANPEFFEFGPRKLATAVFLPSDHDGTTLLPVLLDPYGGPHAQRVLKSHNPHLVSRWFAEQGFAVLVTDGRGTPGRGPLFEREVWGDLAAPVLEDQLDALDAAEDHFGFLDLQRVGIRGWSFGGYLAALAALRAPERIHAAIAGAPVTTWRLYDTHYTERYLGHPDTYPNHYEQTDLIAEADKLNRPLLLIHGLADDNVVAAHTLQLSTALLVAGRAHQVLPLSGVTHMTPQVAVAENLLELQLTFLRELLG